MVFWSKMSNIWTNLFLATCLLAVVRAADDGVSLDDAVAALEPFGEDCDPKPKREHMEELILNKEDAQYETQCLRYCLMERFELIEAGQPRLHQEKTVDMLGMVWQDREEDLNAIVEICNDENAAVTEKCANAHKHGMCLYREMKERDFEIPEINE